MLNAGKQAFVGRRVIRLPWKRAAWEASIEEQLALYGCPVQSR